jgi:SAM-dependent MidA family methyltransferase
MCQRSSGSAFVTWVGLDADRCAIEDAENRLNWYRSSDLGERGFCSRCGSTLFFRSPRWSGELHVTLAAEALTPAPAVLRIRNTMRQAVVLANEVLDAMPVQLLHFDGTEWLERGVASAGEGFTWADRATALRPPTEAPDLGNFVPGTVTEIHPQAEAFIRSLAERLQRGAAFFIDYGFPEAEYYHLQRTGGTLMCHRAHLADADPLVMVGDKDITAHVNFSAMALAGQDAGLQVLGYTSQARFLLNCGLLDVLAGADIRSTAMAQKLIAEHEMGELFKVLGFARGADFGAMGFAAGDRSHTL